MLEQQREKFRGVEGLAGDVFSKIGLNPNHYSLLSIVFSLICFYFLYSRNFVLALIFFIVSASLDFIDGAVARATKKASKKGAFIDTICDRYVEFIILFGLLFLPLPSFVFSAKVWVFLALLGGLMTTYVKAAAKEKELVETELKKGFFGRGERMILIFLAIAIGIFNFEAMIYPIVVIAVFSNFTALERIYLALNPRQS